MSDTDIFLFLLIGGGLLVGAFKAGANLAREDIIHRLLGMNRINNRWEVREGTEMMGMKWVARHWIYEEGKQNRRISYNDERGDWEFEDGSRPERVHPGLREIAGHWETTDGTSIDPTLMKHLDFADALHDWAIKVAKFVPLGIEAVKLGLQVPERTFIIRKYGEVLEQPGPLLRKESDLPVEKIRLRIELATALLNPDLNEQTKKSLAVAFANLEFFLKPKELETVGAARRFVGDSEIADCFKDASQSGVLPPEAKALAQAIVDDPGDHAVWQNLIKRHGERVYQSAVLTEIASGDDSPNMAKLMAKVDSEIDAAHLALKATSNYG